MSTTDGSSPPDPSPLRRPRPRRRPRTRRLAWGAAILGPTITAVIVLLVTQFIVNPATSFVDQVFPGFLAPALVSASGAYTFGCSGPLFVPDAAGSPHPIATVPSELLAMKPDECTEFLAKSGSFPTSAVDISVAAEDNVLISAIRLIDVETGELPPGSLYFPQSVGGVASINHVTMAMSPTSARLVEQGNFHPADESQTWVQPSANGLLHQPWTVHADESFLLRVYLAEGVFVTSFVIQVDWAAGERGGTIEVTNDGKPFTIAHVAPSTPVVYSNADNSGWSAT